MTTLNISIPLNWMNADDTLIRVYVSSFSQIEGDMATI
jgi:hypothetical protein